jgi:hypothetical protein
MEGVVGDWEAGLKPLVPISDPTSLVREITIRSDTRTMTTNNTTVIKFRKY